MIEDLNKKFRLIFIPYLLLLGACIAGYSFLNWYVYLRKETMGMPEWMLLIAGPSVVAIVVVLIWLRPRIDLFSDQVGSKENGRFGFNILAILAIAIPLVLCQHLLVSATGELKRLKAPSDIGKTGYARYYSIAQFAALKQYAQVTTTRKLSNKRKEVITYNIHFAMPLVDSAVLKVIPVSTSTPAYNNLFPSKIVPKTWLCMTYSFGTEDRNKSVQATYDECLEEFQTLNFSDVTYMERLGINENGKVYRHIIGENYNMGNTEELTILKVHFDSFGKRNHVMLGWTIAGTLICAFFFYLLMFFMSWDEERLQVFEEKRR